MTKLVITVQKVPDHEHWVWFVEVAGETWSHSGGGDTYYECMDDLRDSLDEIKKQVDISDDD